MVKRNVHGWEHLVGDKPNVAAVRAGVLRQLAEVPQPHRQECEERLKSELDHHHFSVRLELYLHHLFKERGWEVDIHPKLPGTTNKPDFRIRRGENEMLVEAKTLLDPKLVEQQDTRLKMLADGLSKRLNRTVSIHPLFDLPSSLPNRQIAAEIEKLAPNIGLNQEFTIKDEHQGSPYALEVTIILDDKPTPTAGVGATVGQAQRAETGRRMREAIQEKAGKYGKPDMSLVIVVWPETGSYHQDDDDSTALYGDEVWELPADHRGELASASEIEERGIGISREPNGVFTLKRDDGTHRYSHVSAVAIYRFLWDLDAPHLGRSSLRVYHNPWAGRPLDINVFQGIPQGIVNLNTGNVEWI